MKYLKRNKKRYDKNIVKHIQEMFTGIFLEDENFYEDKVLLTYSDGVGGDHSEFRIKESASLKEYFSGSGTEDGKGEGGGGGVGDCDLTACALFDSHGTEIGTSY